MRTHAMLSNSTEKKIEASTGPTAPTLRLRTYDRATFGKVKAKTRVAMSHAERRPPSTGSSTVWRAASTPKTAKAAYSDRGWLTPWLPRIVPMIGPIPM